MVSDLPAGTVTFLFTDIEGSTQLLQRLGPDYARVLGEHQALLRAAIAAHGGFEVDTQGDSFFVAFPSAPAAVAAAAHITHALAEHVWPEGAAVRVRIGLHTGTPQRVGDRYVGIDVHRAARIAAAGHGGQVLLSEATRVLTEDDLPEGVALRDLGEYRLKDLQRPERITELVLPDTPGLPSDFPPLRTLDRFQHNLPVQPTPLIDREHEVAAARALLQRSDVRLLTLTGPGGVGKTRLALQVAAELMDAYADGVWFVALSRLTDPALVVPTIAWTLGLQEAGSRPIADVLRDYLRPRHLLVLLDNVEQVVAAAPELAPLLAASAGLKLLATSRVALHLQGEQELPVPPLPVVPVPASAPAQDQPPVEQMLEVPAVALFIARARAHRPDLPLTAANLAAVAAICARLDGLPLAIDLAAARVKVLPPPALLQRLEPRLPLLIDRARDVEARQQTMRAALAWSVDLLQPAERVLFRRLSVFVGSFTLEAVEAVCAAPEGVEPLELDVLEGLERLVDHSLVQPWAGGLSHTADGVAAGGGDNQGSKEPRFRLLYVVREYALEQLEASNGGQEANALRQAYAAYYVARIEQWNAAWHALGAMQDYMLLRTHMDQLESEEDNLRAALTWLRARAETAQHQPVGKMSGRPVQRPGTRGGVEPPVLQGLRLAGTLLWSWAFNGHLREGRAWLEAFLALDAPTHQDSGHKDERHRTGEGGQGGSAMPLAAASARSLRPAWVNGAPSPTLVRAHALYAAGVLAYWQGDVDQAAPLLESSLVLMRGLDGHQDTGYTLNNLGMARQQQGNLEGARACYEESLALGRIQGDRILVSIVLANLSELALAVGDLEQAAALSEEAITVSRQAQALTAAAQSLRAQAVLAWRRGHLSRAATLAEEALTLDVAVRDVRFYGCGLEACALICAAQGQTERAARWLGAAAASRERIGMLRRIDVPTADDIEAAVAPARAALGNEQWAAAFAAGQVMTLEEAIADALGERKENADA